MTLANASWYQRPLNIRARIAAGGVVARLAPDNRVLIALTREPHWSQFILPKGGVEAGESLEAAARREIAEEAGIADLHLLDKLGECERLNSSRTRWVTSHYFLFATFQIAGTPTDTSRAYQLTWAPLAALPEFIWPEQLALVQTQAPLIEQRLRDFLA
jgi:ADP-ribose pyrophosphatase YjhB (NUDIX family)